jgi:amidase
VFDEGTDVVPIAADVRACLERFAAGLAAAGARVDRVRLPVPLADGFKTWQDITMAIIGSGLPEAEYAELAALAGTAGDGPMISVARAMTSRYRDWIAAVDRRQRERRAWASLFEQYDVVLAPVMPTAAHPHDTDRTIGERVLDIDGAPVPYFLALAWCGAIGAALLPVVTLPVGPTAAGLPAGVQVVGPFLSDLRLLRVAEILDAAAGPGFVPPPLG